MEIVSTYSNSFQGASWPLKHSQRSRPSRPSAAGSTTSSWQLSGFVTGANLRCTSCIQRGHYERPIKQFRNDPRGIGICEAMKHFVALSCTFTVCALKFLPVRLQVKWIATHCTVGCRCVLTVWATIKAAFRRSTISQSVRQHSRKKNKNKSKHDKNKNSIHTNTNSCGYCYNQGLQDKHCNQKALPSLSLVVQTHRNCLSLLDLAPAVFSSCFLGLPQMAIRWGFELLSRDSRGKTWDSV